MIKQKYKNEAKNSLYNKKKVFSNSSKFKYKKPTPVGSIYIHTTQNNTILTLVDMAGNTKCRVSAGSLGFKNSRKSSSYAAQAAAEKLAEKALNLGFTIVNVKLNGLGFGKQNAVKTLHKNKLIIVKIEEITPIPHNGLPSPQKTTPLKGSYMLYTLRRCKKEL